MVFQNLHFDQVVEIVEIFAQFLIGFSYRVCKLQAKFDAFLLWEQV